jgi:tetratricopeptide (TPR) repeat protein
LAAIPARAAGPDDQYLRVYGLIQEADALGGRGQLRDAVSRYLEAQAALRTLQAGFPDWNPKVVRYRLDYITSKLEPLNKKLSADTPSPATPAGVAPGPVSVSNQVAALQQEIERLAAQNTLLNAKLREALSVQPAAVDPRELSKAEQAIKDLQKERDLLKVTLDQLQSLQKTGTASGESLDELRRKLVTQESVVSVLQKQNEELHKQLATMGGRRAGEPDAGTGRTKELEKELQAAKAAAERAEKEREALAEQLKQRQPRAGTAPPSDELQRQLAAAQARLAVLDAQRVPYTPEELALFKQAPIKVAATVTNAPPSVSSTNRLSTNAPAAKRPSRELPPAAVPLMAEAERAIDAGRFADAEQKLNEALKVDESNVRVLVNLAAVQLDQDKPAEAEQALKKALASDPEDSASLYLMGSLKFRQQRYDEAVESLSLSARLDPAKPQTQYFLGMALVQKGSRQAAETSFRKAVQLRPDWGDPHYQLAVLYATQPSPATALAGYHYKKAIAGGTPRNPEFERFLEKPAAGRAP